PAKSIAAFSLVSISQTINEVECTISIIPPDGTNVTALVATFTTTGASVKIGTTVQLIGTTPNDFTNPVAYVVMAADGSTATYVRSEESRVGPERSITTFSLLDI